ncbi:unnamed protein product [Aphanomyces euteiches]|uniref:CMGC/CDK protein kinase n=2 Tax=Aphanomyces euteiches TaxID=100861 RepID=A0A6G0XNK9_9STRA|nr:hypothetical protein Ae201684_002932 [Aphanomyces euteiches]KAH9092879.1 hypothetical protein Ae201684P_008545 [Aphanomyces euteiches]KAH9155745.1 hypothetical protein AeRB84_002311 [Aphanomyces euteiches]
MNGLSMEAVAAARGFELIQECVYVPPLVKPPRVEAEPCFCSASEDGNESCHDTECINYATYVECPLNQCPTNSQCCNQRLQHPELFPRLEPFMTEMKGYGVRIRDAVAALAPIGEYVGEVINQKELFRRTTALGRLEINFYYIQLAPGVYIDARNRGGFTRFVNHSCNPNCKAEKWTVNGETRLLVFALRDLSAGEEITFDYQWTVLGRQRIKCFCGEPNCKGFIGDEVEQKVEETPQGMFQDPTEDDCDESLVGRKLRIFQRDDATFSVVIVKRYIPSTNEHEIADVMEEDNDGDDTSQDDPEIRTVVLSTLKWQIYVSFEGLSPEEVQKHVFSIPKVQRTVRDSPPPAMTSSPASATPPRPVTPLAGPKPTSFKLLLKGFSRACDEQFFRRMLGNRSSTLLSVDLFFVDTPVFGNVGWGVLEFSDANVYEAMRVRFDNKRLLTNTVRSFPATSKGLATFQRTKNSRRMLDQKPKRSESPAAPSPRRRSRSPERQPDVYCYGRKLNWVVDNIDPSPSRRSGMSAAVETTLRAKCTKLMMTVVKRLKFEREDASTAVILFHRYTSQHPMNVVNIEWLAATCLHVVLKSHSRQHDWHGFLQAVYAAKNQNDSSPTLKELAVVERHILSLEEQLLDGLRYDISSTDPFMMFDACFKGGNLADDEKVHRLGKYLISDSLPSTLWSQFQVECIVVVVLYIVSAAVRTVDDGLEPPPYLPRLSKSVRPAFDAALPPLLDLFCSKHDNPNNRPAILARVVQFVDAKDSSDAPAIHFIESPWYSAQKAWQTKQVQLTTDHIEAIVAIRRRAFLGRVKASVPWDLAGRDVYLQPWPYREPRNPSRRGMSEACLRELSTLVNLHARDPLLIVETIGIVFPQKRIETPERDTQIDLFPESKSAPPTGLQDNRHYLAFERPLHVMSSLLEANTKLPFPLRKRIVYDLFRSVALCHEHNIVHRFISPSNMFVFAHHVKLGGFYSARHVETKGSNSGGYTLTENEHGEHCTGAALHTTAPEILLGDRVYTKRSDLWTLGCVALNILLLGPPLIVGKEVSKQLDYLYRICGSPREDIWPEAMELPNFEPPKHNYQVRLRKVILSRMADFPVEAIEIFENVLSLDPKRRWPARRALQSPWFADATDIPLDFTVFPSTIENRIEKSSSKRKNNDSSTSSSDRRHRRRA